MSLASQYDNKIPFNKSWISHTIQANSRINWDELFKSDLIECYQDASILPASRQQHATPEVQNNRITEVQNTDIQSVLAHGDNGSDPIFEVYNLENKVLPQCLKMTLDRVKKCKDRAKDPAFLENFRKAIQKAQGCAFLTGSNDRGWKANFDWFIRNDKNVYCVLEGKYSGLFDEEPQNGEPGGD